VPLGYHCGVRVVIDHVAGSRRGQRQEFPAGERIRFGRHPECEVSFDPHRDIDASSRHAELRSVDASWVLVDLGSSNGTYAEGHRITEAPITRNTPVSIEFGPGGPRVRLFVGSDDEIEALAPAPVEQQRPRWIYAAIGGAIVFFVVIVLALARC
jgi:FHA domain